MLCFRHASSLTSVSTTTTHLGFVLPHLPTHVHLLLPPHQPCLVCPVFPLPTSPGGTLAKSPAETLRGCCWVWKTGGGLTWCERVKPPKVWEVDWWLLPLHVFLLSLVFFLGFVFNFFFKTLPKWRKLHCKLKWRGYFCIVINFFIKMCKTMQW